MSTEEEVNMKKDLDEKIKIMTQMIENIKTVLSKNFENECQQQSNFSRKKLRNNDSEVNNNLSLKSKLSKIKVEDKLLQLLHNKDEEITLEHSLDLYTKTLISINKLCPKKNLFKLVSEMNIYLDKKKVFERSEKIDIITKSLKKVFDKEKIIIETQNFVFDNILPQILETIIKKK